MHSAMVSFAVNKGLKEVGNFFIFEAKLIHGYA